jgi:hypothetical protein
MDWGPVRACYLSYSSVHCAVNYLFFFAVVQLIWTFPGILKWINPLHMVHVFIPSTWEPETGGWRVWGYPGLHSETLSKKVKTRQRKTLMGCWEVVEALGRGLIEGHRSLGTWVWRCVLSPVPPSFSHSLCFITTMKWTALLFHEFLSWRSLC